LSDVPASVDLETVVLAWARRESANPGEECLVAFRHDDASFKVVRIEGHSEEHHVYAA